MKFVPLTDITVDIDPGDLTLESFSYSYGDADYELDGYTGMTPDEFQGIDKLDTYDPSDLAVVRVDDLAEMVSRASVDTDRLRSILESVLSQYTIVGASYDNTYIADVGTIVKGVMEYLDD